MSSEVIKLNLIPKGDMPVFHASQFDKGRLITCELYRGEDAYSVPEGYTVELHCRKVDNKIVTMASTSIINNVVIFTSTEQLTACNGKNLCEVAILDDGYRIGTLNFILEVEIDPLKGGITSTSEIHNLEAQVEEITTEIVGENYYNKTEVDNLLDDKADADTVYTKTETDTKLALKANAADVYTKSETDTKLALKANAADVYTKTEVDNIIMDIMPVGTASGPIATFNTELAAPLVNVSCNIIATGGNGTPDNPIPINGYTEANITRCGVNLLPNCTAESHTANSVTVTCNSDGTFTSTGTATGGSFLHDYTMTQNLNIISGMYLHCGNDFNSATLVLGFRYTDGTGTDFTLSSNNRIIDLSSYVGKKVNKIRIYGANGTVMNGTIMPMVLTVNAPTAYTSYNGQTYAIAFGQTVYGGVLDVTRGKLTVTHIGEVLDINDKLSITNIGACSRMPFRISNVPQRVSSDICSIAPYLYDYSADTPHFYCVVAGGNNVCYLFVDNNDISSVTTFTVCYKLATPFDIDLTPEVISAIVGENNVYSDTNGDTTVKFKDTIQNYIDKKVST